MHVPESTVRTMYMCSTAYHPQKRKFSMHQHSFRDTERKLRRQIEDYTGTGRREVKNFGGASRGCPIPYL